MLLEQALRLAAPGAKVSSEVPDRHAYARDLWPRGLIELQAGEAPSPGPRAIVWPETVEQVQGLVAFARAQGVSLVPFGAGSGVCGAIFPSEQSVVVDLKRFKSFDVGPGPELDVGAGALGISLEEALLERGYTIGHYPSSILISSVGGWVAARGAGQTSGRYGKIEDMVTSLELVLGTGERVRARRRELGPDLIPLLVGSEGTLGIITRVGLRLHPAPTARAFAAFAFDDVKSGIDALRRLFQDGLRPAVARLYDPLDTLLMADQDVAAGPQREGPGEPGLGAAALRAVLRAPALIARAMALAERSLYARVALVLVHEGAPDAVETEAARAASLCRRGGGTPLGEGPARAWYHHRYHVSYRQAPLFRGGAFSDTMEVAVPWSNLFDVYEAVRCALGRHALVMAHFSHSYPDGASIYFTFAAIGHGGASALAVYDRAWRVALSAALDAGATLSHHHGVGRSKAPRLGEELGAAIGVVRRLKSAWDPDGILNPGALLPAPGSAEAERAPPPSSEPALDSVSALCALPGSLRLSDAEAWLAERGHTLGLGTDWAENAGRSIDQWLGLGLPGSADRYADPAGVRLSGFTASLKNGVRIALRAAPRRAVGPDLSALFVGTRGAFGQVELAVLAAPRVDSGRVTVLPWSGERNPVVDVSESAALERVRVALEA